MEKPIVAVYVRVSSRKQDEASQVPDLQRWIAAYVDFDAVEVQCAAGCLQNFLDLILRAMESPEMEALIQKAAGSPQAYFLPKVREGLLRWKMQQEASAAESDEE